MKLYNRFKTSIQGFSNAFSRFPLTAAFLVTFTILDGMMIYDGDFEFEKYLVTLAVGVFISAVLQMVYERFCTRSIARIMFMVLGVVLTFGYYLIIRNVPELSMEIGIKTAVAIFGLLIGFLWIPSIKSKITFNETSMAGFKSFFISFFFSGVMMMGLSLIYGATDQLLFNVHNDIYAQTANIVFFLFATMYFLSLIPRYPGNRDLIKEDNYVVAEEISKATFCPKFLGILISYIIIPLSMIFTLILLMYIVINISGSFWEDALLEPMLVSYIIVVILLYILASRLENQFAKTFRKIFPKVLLPIVLFQTVNSVLKIGDFGLTHGRYYVIMFGIFAFISGLVFSFKSVEKNGIVPMVLIICIVIATVPPVDAFTVSRASQVRMLENVLINNAMLIEGQIIPKDNIDDQGKKKITEMVRYLDQMDYDNNIEWMPEDFNYYNDFDDVFGFSPYRNPVKYSNGDREDIYISTNMDEMVDISGYDWFIQTYIGYSEGGREDNLDHEFEYKGKSYRVLSEEIDEDIRISIYGPEGDSIVAILGKDIVAKFEDYSMMDEMIPMEEASVISENDRGAIKIVVQHIDIYNRDEEYRFNGGIYLLVKVK
jgi:hypothetical protein